MSIWTKVSSQFGHPRGLLGRLAGFIMAHRTSNIERINWAVDLLRLKPHDTVLEIGCGPGVAIEKMSTIITTGFIYGLDHSEVMIAHASRRIQNAAASAKVRLIVGSVYALPTLDRRLDKVLDINSFQFWSNQIECLVQLRKRMAPGGMLAIAHQPRKPGATDSDADDAGKKFRLMLEQAGFKHITMEKRIMKPVSTICLLALNK